MGKEQGKRSTKGLAYRVLLVDDHPLVREGLVQVVEQEPDLEVCGHAESAGDGLDAARRLEPDLVVVDLTLKDSDGLELVKNLRSFHPNLPILVLSMHDESFYAERALRAGAKGYLMKGGQLDEVIRAIRRVLKGGIYLSDEMSATILHRLVMDEPAEEGSAVSALSDRELQVFELIGRGMGPSRIAERLNLSVKTIETYRSHIKSKLDLKNALELRQYAIRWNQERELA